MNEFVSCYKNISKPIKYFTILGERHSGTNFLEHVISKNLSLDINWNYGWKHWIGSGCHWKQYQNTQDVLFLGIVRNIYDWIGGMLTLPHHLFLKDKTYESLISAPKASGYVSDLFISYGNQKIKKNNDINSIIIQEERNYINQKFYRNIFEARDMKNRFLYHYMPFLVDNYILLTYESFRFNHKNICQHITSFFDIDYKRPYRLRREVTDYATNKKSYDLPDNIINIINKNTNWDTEYVFGYLPKIVYPEP